MGRTSSYSCARGGGSPQQLQPSHALTAFHYLCLYCLIICNILPPLECHRSSPRPKNGTWPERQRGGLFLSHGGTETEAWRRARRKCGRQAASGQQNGQWTRGRRRILRSRACAPRRPPPPRLHEEIEVSEMWLTFVPSHRPQ